jgi:hypothetical protein
MMASIFLVLLIIVLVILACVVLFYLFCVICILLHAGTVYVDKLKNPDLHKY